MDLETLEAVNAARAARRAVAAVTDLATGRTCAIAEGEAGEGPLGEAVREALRAGTVRTVAVEGAELFVNPHAPPARLVVIGAVHISQALAPMARAAGLDVLVIDPRGAFATPERFEGTELVADWPDETLAARPLDPHTALAAVTHDPKIDDGPLLAALNAGCFYVGALGSRKTHAARRGRLLDAGATNAMLDRIEAPIGLDIGAATPAEIAVAVLGSVIRARRRRAP